MMATRMEQLLEEMKDSPVYVAEGLVLELGEQMVARMEKLGITRADLARRMGVSPAYITKILRGTNISMLTLAKIAIALECSPKELLGCKKPQSVKSAHGVDERLVGLLIERHREALEGLARR